MVSKKSVEEVIAVLNTARAMELGSIHQYMIHHYTLDDMDYGGLASAVKKISIDEMRHAEMFAERIKELGGVPLSKPHMAIQNEHTFSDIFPYDRHLETETLEKYNEFIKVCVENGDNVSKSLFERILNEEQEHWNYFDDTSTHIDTLGKEFLAKMTGGSAD